jgi:hypothetical protein
MKAKSVLRIFDNCLVSLDDLYVAQDALNIDVNSFNLRVEEHLSDSNIINNIPIKIFLFKIF